jgi:hypothetical protein
LRPTTHCCDDHHPGSHQFPRSVRTPSTSVARISARRLRSADHGRIPVPSTLKGHVVFRSLDDAVRFMTGYQPFMRESVLHRLEIGERDAANAFREWVEMEDLIESD